MKIDLYSFLSRGILTDHALDGTQRLKSHSNSIALEKEVLKKLPYSQFEERHVSTARRMAVVFVAISTFENMIRDYVDRVMTNNVGPNWWIQKAPQNLKNRVDGRIAKEKKVPWHTPRGGKALNYADFGDLSDLISALWVNFDQEVQDQERLKSTFNVIELSRNACMHGGSISDRDIERVGMLMRDWLEQLSTACRARNNDYAIFKPRRFLKSFEFVLHEAQFRKFKGRIEIQQPHYDFLPKVGRK